MSIQSKIEQAGIKARRKLWDSKITLTGKTTNVFRVKVVENKYADEEYTVIDSGSITMTIDYPMGQIPLNRFRVTTQPNPEDISDAGIFLFDVLPIEVYTKFSDNVEKGDFIIDVIKDENGINIPLLLRASETIGSFFTSLLWKKMQVSPYSGNIIPTLQTLIDNYVAGLNYVVTYNSDGGSVVLPKTIIPPENTVQTLPTEPTKDTYAFGGWFTQLNGEGTQFLANTIVTGNLTVYANWLGT